MESWSFALTVLGWQENLQEDEMPPRWMWSDNAALNDHFKELKAKWKGERDHEAPEGTMADAATGKNVTLRNKFADQWTSQTTSDPFYD